MLQQFSASERASVSDKRECLAHQSVLTDVPHNMSTWTSAWSLSVTSLAAETSCQSHVRCYWAAAQCALDTSSESPTITTTTLRPPQNDRHYHQIILHAICDLLYACGLHTDNKSSLS